MDIVDRLKAHEALYQERPAIDSDTRVPFASEVTLNECDALIVLAADARNEIERLREELGRHQAVTENLHVLSTSNMH